MNLTLLLICLSLFQDNVPYKSTNAFDLKFDYEFKNAVRDNTKAYGASEFSSQRISGPQPYLTLTLTLLQLTPEEVRIKILDNQKNVLTNKKVAINDNHKIVAGFTVDMKDRITPHEFTVLFLGKEKNTISKIVIHVSEDGSFLVNGEKRGQF